MRILAQSLRDVPYTNNIDALNNQRKVSLVFQAFQFFPWEQMAPFAPAEITEETIRNRRAFQTLTGLANADATRDQFNALARTINQLWYDVHVRVREGINAAYRYNRLDTATTAVLAIGAAGVACVGGGKLFDPLPNVYQYILGGFGIGIPLVGTGLTKLFQWWQTDHLEKISRASDVVARQFVSFYKGEEEKKQDEP